MSEEMEKCDNCLKMFPESKIPTHFGYCRRNIKKCDKCGEMYDINFLEEHEEEFHKQAKCQYCKADFPANDLKGHERKCLQKPEFCEYCQQNVPVQEYPSHLRACESRTRNCDKCTKPVTNKDYLIHITTCRGIEEPKVQPPSYNKHIEEQLDRFKKNRRADESDDYYYKEREDASKNYYKPSGYAREEKPKEVPPQYGRGFEKKDSYKDKEIYREKDNKYEINYSNKPTSNYGISKPSSTVSRSYGTTGQRASSKGNPDNRSSKQINSRIEPKREEQKYNMGSRVPVKKEEPRMPIRKEEARIPVRKEEARMPIRKEEARMPNQRDARNNRDVKPVVNYPSSNYNANSGKTGETKAQKPPTTDYYQGRPKQPAFDIKDYYESDQIPMDVNELREVDIMEGLGGDADLNEQMMIWESMKNQGKKTVTKVPKQFQGVDIMNESFYKDVDIEKQRALLEDLEKNKRKRY